MLRDLSKKKSLKIMSRIWFKQKKTIDSAPFVQSLLPWFNLKKNEKISVLKLYYKSLG